MVKHRSLEDFVSCFGMTFCEEMKSLLAIVKDSIYPLCGG